MLSLYIQVTFWFYYFRVRINDHSLKIMGLPKTLYDTEYREW